MTSKTLRRLLGLAEAKDTSHAFADRTRERVVGFRVLVLDDPNAVLVLKNTVIGTGLDAAVATGGTAGAGAGVLAGLRWMAGSPHRGQQCKKNRTARNNSASREPVLPLRRDSHSFARMERNPQLRELCHAPAHKFLILPVKRCQRIVGVQFP